MDTQLLQPFHCNNVDEDEITLAEHERGRKLARLKRSAQQHKQLLVDHIEYDAAELEVQEQQLTAAAKQRQRDLNAEVAKLKLAAEERQREFDAKVAKLKLAAEERNRKLLAEQEEQK